MGSTLYFRATEDQVREIIINALKDGIPLGENMFYHGALPEKDPGRKIKFSASGSIHVKVLFHRKIHIHFIREGPLLWSLCMQHPIITEQSWSRKYHTWEDLITSVPGVVICENSSVRASQIVGL